MNEVTTMLRELMDKLGITAEQAWPHLVQYVWMTGLTHVIMVSVFGLIAAIVAGVCTRVGLARIREAKEKDTSWNEHEVVPFFFGAGILVIFTAIVLGMGLSESIPKLIEPEGYLIFRLVN